MNKKIIINDMKKNVLFPVLIFSLVACGASNISTEVNTDATYGFTEKNPIKVGGVENGPLNERQFLNSLSGPNGETVSYDRVGSCCEFATRNSPLGGGLLDMYKVSYEGKKDTVTMYLNMYDKAKLKAPVGFKFK